jgi:hypothetical protein
VSTWALVVFVALSLVGDVLAWRKQRREHREFMEAMRKQWRGTSNGGGAT